MSVKILKEKRYFKRYHRETVFKVGIGSKTFNARTFDYSIEGFGAFIEDSPEIKVGDILSLNLTHPNIKTSGKVVWAKKTNGGIQVGISRLGLLYGSLTDFSIADIVLGLQRSGKTGVLHLMNAGVHKSLYVQRGDMIFASSNQPDERLGEFLMSQGIINKEQYDKSVEYMKKTSRRQGSILMELGYINSDTLLWAVKTSVENIILSFFSMREGDFMFKEGPLPKEEVITLKLSAANIIFKGIKKLQGKEMVALMLPPDAIKPGLSTDPLDLFQDIDLEEPDRHIMTLVDGKRTVKEIINSSGIEEFSAMKSIFGLISTRLVHIDAEEPSIMEPEEMPDESAIRDAVGQKAQADELIDEIDMLHLKIRGMNYYDILGIGKTAASSDIKKSYYSMARKYHPDRHYQLPDDMKDKLNVIFTQITTAYSTLISSDLRKDYDSKPAARQEIVDPVKRASDRFRAGKEAMKASDYNEAARLFSEAAYLDSSTAVNHYYYGVSLMKLGKLKEAERAIRRALNSEPFNPDYLAEIGHIYVTLEMPTRARGSFEKAIKLNPAHVRALEGMKLVSTKP